MNDHDPSLDRAPARATGTARSLAVVGWAVFAVLLAVVVIHLVDRLEYVLGLTLLAGAVALLSLPLQRRFARRLGRGPAAAVVALLSMVVLGTLGVLVFHDLGLQAHRLDTEISDRIDALAPGGLAASVAQSLRLKEGVSQALGRLPSETLLQEESTAAAARQAIDFLVVLILAAFFQSGGAAVLDWAVMRWPRPERRDVREFLTAIERRGVRAARHAILRGLAMAVVVTAVAIAGDVTGPAVLGAWAGLWTAVSLPLVGVAPVAGVVALESVPMAIVMGVMGLAAAYASRRLRLRTERATVCIGLAPAVVATAVGFSIARVGGVIVTWTLVAMLIAASEQLVARRTAPEDLPSEAGDAPDAAPAADVPDVSAPPGGRSALASVVRGHELVITPGWRPTMVVAGAAASGALVWLLWHRLSSAIVWLAIALLVAVALDRPLVFLQRYTRRRSFAAALVAVVFGAVVVAAAATGLSSGTDATTSITEDLPGVVKDLEDLPLVGPWLEHRDASVWVANQVEDLPQRLGDARDAAEWLPSIGSRALDFFWTLLLIVAFVLDGPRMVAGIDRLIPARSRRQTRRLASVSRNALAGYAAGAALVAGINASVVLTIALVLGIALAPVLAVWAFCWNFVPQVGGFMGGLPLVLFALAAGPAQALLAGLLYLTYQLIENHVIQPTVIGEAIDVPPWATLLCALAGGAAAGVVGAVVFTPLAGAVKVLLAEVKRPDFPGATVPAAAPEEPAVASRRARWRALGDRSKRPLQSASWPRSGG